jgi:peptidoglycan/xylan/chitin deacetylase (PgdA/CDA1 family)
MRYLWREKVIILTYHGFTDRELHEGIENYQGKHLFIERFRSQLEYLIKYHQVISLNELVDAYAHGRPLPERSVVITLDDGYRSNYTLAFPLLKQFKIPAAIFLTTRFVDKEEWFWTDRIEYALNKARPTRFELRIDPDANGGTALPIECRDRESRISSEKQVRMKLKTIPQESRSKVIEALEERLGTKLSQEDRPPEIYRPLEWAEIMEMTQTGLVLLGSHSHTHKILTKCQPLTLERELSLSREMIERRAGLPCRFFCYPNGNVGDFNEETKRGLKKAGYRSGLTSVPGVNDKHSDIF